MLYIRGKIILIKNIAHGEITPLFYSSCNKFTSYPVNTSNIRNYDL